MQKRVVNIRLLILTSVGILLSGCSLSNKYITYNGAYYLDETLQDSAGNVAIDKNTGRPIPNPEFAIVAMTVGKPKLNQDGRYINQSLPKAYVIGADGNINMVDRDGNMTTIDRKTKKIIKITQIPIHEIHGRRYFEFEGKKYYADPNN